MSIVARNIRFGFDGREVLRGADLELDAPGLTLILGKNGSGKSTLLRVLAGLLPASGGSVELGGRPVSAWPAREKARLLSWLAQGPVPTPPWPVFDYVLSARYPHHRPFEGFSPEDRRRAGEALERFDIMDLSGRRVDHLSGGEQQLARIARAFVQDTPFLLLDEPFAALDIRHRALVWRALTSESRTSVAVTHDISMIGPSCRRLLLFVDGRVFADGAPEDVLTRERLETAFSFKPPDGWAFRPTNYF